LTLSSKFYTIVYMKKYHVDYKQFANVSTPEAAYFLGFLWADGHVRTAGKTTYQISIKNEAVDMKELIPIFERLGTWGVTQIQPKGNRKPQTQITITDIKLGKLLDNYGYLKKSIQCATSVINLIPDNLKHYWFRGYFDGDGCITLQKQKYPTVSFSGAYEQDFTFLFNLLNRLDINYKYYQRVLKGGNRNAVVTFNGRVKSKILYDFLYQGKCIGLNRKKIKFEYALREKLNTQNRFIEFNGEKNSLANWSKLTGINRKTISDRIDMYGWTVEKALTTKPK
jgi:DNA-binding transcriptional regulator WhiA